MSWLVLVDCLQAVEAPRYVTGHPGQLSLLPSVGLEMSSCQRTMMLCAGE